MSFYPILKAPGCEGWTTLCNFPPNNWEGLSGPSHKIIYLVWSDGSFWNYRSLGILRYKETKTIKFSDVKQYIDDSQQGFLFLSSPISDEKLFNSSSLVDPLIEKYSTPDWRSSLGLSYLSARTSYQGEMNVFPISGSLLSMSPMHQQSDKVDSYLLFANLERLAKKRSGTIEIYAKSDLSLQKKIFVSNNAVNIIKLSDISLSSDDLLLVVSKNIAGIPLFFSKSLDGKFMSLEHTHPPASYVIHGKRYELQKFVKKLWLQRV